MGNYGLERRASSRRHAEERAPSRGVYGPTGAAALLGMKPTTLASRIKRLRLSPRAAASSSGR